MEKEVRIDMMFEHASVYSYGDGIVVSCDYGCCGNYLSSDEAIQAARAILKHFNEEL